MWLNIFYEMRNISYLTYFKHEEMKGIKVF